MEQARRSLLEERQLDERNEIHNRGFADRDRHQSSDGPHILERSFSGSYPDESSR